MFSQSESSARVLVSCDGVPAMWHTFSGAPVVALLAAAFAAVSAQSHAETVTFRFEAEVASIILNNGGSALLPEVTVGETVLATFQFESSVPGLNHPQSMPFEFVLSGAEYSSPNYSITVRDESENWFPFPGTIADPENALIDDRGPGGVSDVLWLGSFGGSSGVFDTVLSGTNGGIEWHAPILFAGEQSTFDENIVPAEPSVWNSMIFKELAIEFVDIGTNKSTRVGAFITDVSLIPEPTSVSLLFIAVITSLVAGRFHRRIGKGVRNLFILVQRFLALFSPHLFLPFPPLLPV